MLNDKYELRYLPLFYKDLEEKVTYIIEKLKNAEAANDLVDKVEAAILERLPMAEAFETYSSIKERRYPYYRIYVGNYIIYYVVIDDEQRKPVMEIRRFLYKGQNQRSRV